MYLSFVYSIENLQFIAIGCLDVLLTFGAYTMLRGMAISRLVIRFFWWAVSSAGVLYLYL